MSKLFARRNVWESTGTPFHGTLIASATPVPFRMNDDRTNFNTNPAILVLLGIVFLPIALIHVIAVILPHF